MSTFTLRGLLFSALLFTACAHQEPPIPATREERKDPRDIPACVEFETPKKVICHAMGKQIVNFEAKKYCQAFFPDRFILTDVDDLSITFVGASCFTVVDGAH